MFCLINRIEILFLVFSCFMVLKIFVMILGVRFKDGLFIRIIEGFVIMVWLKVSICCLLFER